LEADEKRRQGKRQQKDNKRRQMKVSRLRERPKQGEMKKGSGDDTCLRKNNTYIESEMRKRENKVLDIKERQRKIEKVKERKK
jgi:hypothetical protein